MFSVSFCLHRACFTHLISSNSSCNLCLWYFDQLVHLNKEINANENRHSLWEYSKRFYCSFEWHLTPHITLSIEICIRRTLLHSPRASSSYRFHCTSIRGKFMYNERPGNCVVMYLCQDKILTRQQNSI